MDTAPPPATDPTAKAEALEVSLRDAAERRAADRAALHEALTAKYGDDVLDLEHDGHRAYFLTPPRPEWRRFMKFSSNADKRSGALEELDLGCVVHVGGGAVPQSREVAREMLNALFDRRPGLAETFGNALCKKAGLDGEAEAKKL